VTVWWPGADLPRALVLCVMTQDIVDVAIEAGSFRTLATALTVAGLVDTLKGPGPFTVFAPTDEAFAKIPKVGPGAADPGGTPRG
jgi:uncharacterized surface protein with fasciclin (FAS1) repeats